MRRALLTIGLTLAMLCAFGVSAAATVILADGHNMHGLLPYMLVGVLELLSTGCAWGWVTSTDARLKGEFAAIMSASSAVSLAAGVLAFGWVGCFPALALIASVHVTSRMWVVPGQSHQDKTTTSRRDTAVSNAVTEPVSERVTESVTAPAPLPEPSVNPPGTLADSERNPNGDVDEDDARRVEDLREWARELGRMPGRDKVKDRYGVGSSKANQLRTAADRPTIRAVRDA